MAFDPNWPHGHTTRNGYTARIICTDAEGPFSIVALIKTAHGEVICKYDATGLHQTGAYSFNLINAPDKVERWVNYYEVGSDAFSYSSLRDAKEAADGNRITATLKLTFIDGKPVSAEIVEA